MILLHFSQRRVEPLIVYVIKEPNEDNLVSLIDHGQEWQNKVRWECKHSYKILIELRFEDTVSSTSRAFRT